MATTTVRVDADTHALLTELSTAAHTSMTATVRDAARALHRHRFARRVASEYAALTQDPALWADYLGEAEATHVTDGVG